MQLKKKNAEDVNRHFSKEDIEMDKAYGKMLNITNFREMQIKTTVSYVS